MPTAPTPYGSTVRASSGADRPPPARAVAPVPLRATGPRFAACRAARLDGSAAQYPSGSFASASPARPNRITGRCGDSVTYVASRCGATAKTSPATTANCGLRTPAATTTASHTRPVIAVKSVAVIRVLYEAYSTPPKPARPADTANSSSFVRTTDTPDAAAASGAERTASMARPQREPRSRVRSATSTPLSSTSASPMARSSPRSTGPATGRGISHPVSPLRSHPSWKSTWSARKASARVARASDLPPSRRAGRATTAPSRAAAAVPTAAAARKDQPWLISSPATRAAPVTNVAWASDTIAPRPVTTVNDMNTSPIASPWARVPLQNGVVTV